MVFEPCNKKNEMKNLIVLGLLLLFLGGCKSMDSAAKVEKALETKNLVENSDFEISFTWANPLFTNEIAQLSNANLLPLESRSGRINLLGSANYIKKRGDSLEIYLPYYGTRQIGVQMGSNNGAIEFTGIPTDYELAYNEKKRHSEISFKMKEDTERYRVYITVDAEQNVSVNLNSTQRTSIKYTGKVSALKEE